MLIINGYPSLIGDFLRALQFPSPIMQENWPPWYNWNIDESSDKHHNHPGPSCRDGMLVGLITTNAIRAYHMVSSNPAQVIYNYVIKCVSDLRQVGGFLRVLRFPPQIKLTTMIYSWLSLSRIRWDHGQNSSQP